MTAAEKNCRSSAEATRVVRIVEAVVVEVERTVFAVRKVMMTSLVMMKMVMIMIDIEEVSAVATTISCFQDVRMGVLPRERPGVPIYGPGRL